MSMLMSKRHDPPASCKLSSGGRATSTSITRSVRLSVVLMGSLQELGHKSLLSMLVTGVQGKQVEVSEFAL